MSKQTEELREKIIKEVNKFRWEYIELKEKRTPSPEDIIILQGNIAEKILTLMLPSGIEYLNKEHIAFEEGKREGIKWLERHRSRGVIYHTFDAKGVEPCVLIKLVDLEALKRGELLG